MVQTKVVAKDLIRSASIISALTAAVAFDTPIIAQSVLGMSAESPPEFSSREYGINLSTTDVQLQHTDLSVGEGTFPSKLELTRTYNSIGYPVKNISSINVYKGYNGFGLAGSNSILSFFTVEKCSNNPRRIISITAVVFDKTYHFSGGGCAQGGAISIVSNDQEGALMRVVDPSQASWNYELVTKLGVRVWFTDSPGYQYDTMGGRYATFAEFKNGEFLKFEYEASPYRSGTVRPTSVVNAKGIGIGFRYGPSQFGYAGRAFSDTSLISSAFTFEVRGQSRLDISNVYYYYDSTRGFVTSFYDASGGLYRYSYNLGRPESVFRPNNSGANPSFSFTYVDGTAQTASFTQDNIGAFFVTGIHDGVQDVEYTTPSTFKDAIGNVTKFEFKDPVSQDPMVVKVTRPDLSWMTLETILCPDGNWCNVDPYFNRSPTHVNRSDGASYDYVYDLLGRMKESKNPEGDIKKTVRNVDGNIVENRLVGKLPQSQPDIVSYTGFSACGFTNYKTCGSPEYAIDSSGGRWDFKYDVLSGELAASLSPPDFQGYRRITKYSYTKLDYGPVSPPQNINSLGIYLLTEKDECRTSSVTGGNIDFSYTCPYSDRTRESYSYVSPSATSGSNYSMSSIKQESMGEVRDTYFSYDAARNVTEITKSGSGTSYSIYDTLRRKSLEVGFDPDQGGPLGRPMIRHNFDRNGNETSTEFGTGAAANGQDFTVQKTRRRLFDLNDNMVRVEEVLP